MDNLYDIKELINSDFLESFLLMVFVFAAVNYVLSGRAYKRIAHKLCDNLAWMAWVPVLNSFCAAKYSDQWLGGKNTNKLIGCTCLSFVFGFMGALSVIINMPGLFLFTIFSSLILSIIMFIYSIKSIYVLFKCFDPSSAGGYTYLSVFIPFAKILLLYKIGGKQPYQPYNSWKVR